MLNFYHSRKISQIYFSVTNNVCINKIIDEAFKIIKIVYDRQIDSKVIKKIRNEVNYDCTLKKYRMFYISISYYANSKITFKK